MNPPNTPSTSRPPARIVAAAMLMKDNSIVVGIRHFSPDMRAIMRRAYGEKNYHLQVVEQGLSINTERFTTAKPRGLSRRQRARFAK